MILRGIVQLALLRALRPAFGLACALLLVWVLASTRASDNVLRAAGSELAPLWSHGAPRAAAWTVTALAVAGWTLLQALLPISGWRRRDVDWLAPRGARASALVLSTWIGLVAATLVCAGAAAAVIEICVNRAQPSWREGAPAFAQGDDWLDAAHAQTLPLGAQPLQAGTRLRLSFAFVSSGPQALVRAVVAGPAGAELARAEQAVTSRGTLELALPACPADSTLRLEALGREARVYHEASAARLWLPVANEGLASLALLARLLLDSAACCAVALALSGWFSPPTAVFALGSLALLALGADVSSAPLAGLVGALATLQEGRVPRWPSPGELATAACLTAAGLGLATLSLRRWRRER